jgi:hypothetical protein
MPFCFSWLCTRGGGKTKNGMPVPPPKVSLFFGKKEQGPSSVQEAKGAWSFEGIPFLILFA